MSTIARRLEQQYPDQQTGRGVRLIPFEEAVVRSVRPALLMLLGAVGFVLLIACTNVANLLLARAAARRREIAIRSALGAGRGRLIRQFLTESVLLSLMGGVLGLLLAQWGVEGLTALAADSLPRASEVGLDWRVLSFTLVVSLLTGIGFGLAPALQVSKADVQEALKDGGNAGSSPRGNWLRSLLAVAEVASALVLLIGAGLLIKSFLRVQNVETGLRPENVLTMKISLPAARYDTTEKVAAFHQQLLERVAALPGVEAAGAINLLPVQESGWNANLVQVEGQAPYDTGRGPLIEFRTATPDYFRALSIPLVAGRFFNANDRGEGASLVIVNQTLVKRFIPDADPIGRRIRADSNWMTIIGVVGDVKQTGLTQDVRPEIFSPYTAPAWSGMAQNMSYVVRSTGDAPTLTAAMRREVQSVDPNQPIYNVLTMEEVLERSVSSQRLNMMLLSLFAGVAMLLAMIGIYSVMSYLVTQHTREIGIRMALGAQPWDVLKLVLGQGLLLTLVGVCVGAAGAMGLTRLISSLLFGVTATDPLIFLGGAVLLILTALLACYVPARRAMKVDPMVALRYE